MKVAAIKKFRAMLAADEPVYGLWVTLESASITEMAVALGLDWVVIDAEHGHLDLHEVLEHVRATVRSHTVVLVRIAALDGAMIKRVLDIGADGVVIPWMETSDQLVEALACARYPPQGKRGIGAERATGWGQCFVEHVSVANENVLVVPIIESVAAGRNIAELVKVPGIDLFFFGPADYSATAGYRGQWEGGDVGECILRAKDIIRAAGKSCGVVATGNDNLLARVKQGFRMLGLGLDAGLLLRSLHGALATVGRDRSINASLSAIDEPLTLYFSEPPRNLRPDRPEKMMSDPLSGAVISLASGVDADELVGPTAGARGLTTALARFATGASLPAHRHPFSELITVVYGRVQVQVEGRLYELGPLDAIAIPARLGHSVANPSPAEALLHTAMATDLAPPAREAVRLPVNVTRIPENSIGQPGAERVVRAADATGYVAGPETNFIDYCNDEMIPGFGLSGGYARFGPGGRLPAHLHEFDESICIIEGEALCMVEGTRHSLRDCATAFVPRGRVHYFSNESTGPMSMIWVYAGARPTRVVVDDVYATRPATAWPSGE